VRIASQFHSTITLQRLDNSVEADAKSILSILMLAASRGTELRVTAEGEDAPGALDAVLDLFARDFDEPEVAKHQPRDAIKEEIRCKGLGVSAGVAMGRVLRLQDGTRDVYRAEIDGSDVERERRRFRAAVRLSRRQLEAIKERAEKELGRGHAYIFDAHLLFLEDAKLTRDVEQYIVEKRANAEWAAKVVGDRLLSIYMQINDEILRERGSDIEDVIQRLLANLTGEGRSQPKLTEDAVIVAQDLLPSTIAELDLNHVRAIATDAGGWTSHMAIIARGLGLTAVVGLRDFYHRTRTGDQLIVDAERGEVILNPSAASIQRFDLRRNPVRPPCLISHPNADQWLQRTVFLLHCERISSFLLSSSRLRDTVLAVLDYFGRSSCCRARDCYCRKTSNLRRTELWLKWLDRTARWSGFSTWVGKQVTSCQSVRA
jgi:phosphotransferase system HPr (HPr) family protein